VGFAHLLGETRLDREQRSYLDLLQKSAQEAMNLIERILGFERVRRGETNPSRAQTDVIKLCRSVIQDLRPSADRKKLPLVIEVSDSVASELPGDADMIQQILHELIDNAIKYTRNGQVTVAIHSDDPGALRVSVRDTGVGIPEERLPSLFTPFSPGNGAQDRSATGLGLGLAMCREWVTSMGGRIGCDSKLGQGSTFWFTIPRS